jgi:hypothetical protein
LDNGRYGLILENSTEGILDGMVRVLGNPDLLAQFRSRIPEAQQAISFEKGLQDFEKIMR